MKTSATPDNKRIHAFVRFVHSPTGPRTSGDRKLADVLRGLRRSPVPGNVTNPNRGIVAVAKAREETGRLASSQRSRAPSVHERSFSGSGQSSSLDCRSHRTHQQDATWLPHPTYVRSGISRTRSARPPPGNSPTMASPASSRWPTIPTRSSGTSAPRTPGHHGGHQTEVGDPVSRSHHQIRKQPITAQKLYLDGGPVARGGVGMKMELRAPIRAGEGVGRGIVALVDAGFREFRLRRFGTLGPSGRSRRTCHDRHPQSLACH